MSDVSKLHEIFQYRLHNKEMSNISLIKLKFSTLFHNTNYFLSSVQVSHLSKEENEGGREVVELVFLLSGWRKHRELTL